MKRSARSKQPPPYVWVSELPDGVVLVGYGVERRWHSVIGGTDTLALMYTAWHSLRCWWDQQMAKDEAA